MFACFGDGLLSVCVCMGDNGNMRKKKEIEESIFYFRKILLFECELICWVPTRETSRGITFSAHVCNYDLFQYLLLNTFSRLWLLFFSFAA